MKCCYKIVNSDGVVTGVEGVHDHEVEDYFDTDHNNWYIAITYEEYIEITQEEYDSETAKQWEEYISSLPVEIPSDEPSYDELLEKNSELEKENAALLFQLLTGEEYTDV